MLLTKLKSATAVLLVLGIAACGGGVVTQFTTAAERCEPPTGVARPEQVFRQGPEPEIEGQPSRPVEAEDEPPVAAPQPVKNGVSATDLVNYLNDNAQRIHGLRCSNLEMTWTSGLQSVGFRGQLAAQRPRNLRMKAKVVGQDTLDLGFNDKEFWWWCGKAQPPHQFYGSFKDLASGRIPQSEFPFHPNWIMEVLGLGSYGPPERYTLVTEAETFKLVEKCQSVEGRPVRKVTVLKRQSVLPPVPQVLAHLLLDDATGLEICTAHIAAAQPDSGTGALLPRRIEFRWIMSDKRWKLAMTLDGLSVNSEIAGTAWARPSVEGESFNLATQQIEKAK